MIPYAKHETNDLDASAVASVVENGLLTTGPQVKKFEEAVAWSVASKDSYTRPAAVAVSSGTAALHCALAAAGVGPGHEVIVPAMTFAATANVVIHLGAKPVFCDVEPDTLLMDVEDMQKKLRPETQAVVPVDYAGQPCDYDSIVAALEPTEDRPWVVADACHSLGGSYKDRPVGSLADLTCFSFHPVKVITTGEGGMVVTASTAQARFCKRFRNHGINIEYDRREGYGYDLNGSLGFNYRLTDIQCILGLSQLDRLDDWINMRRQISRCYDKAFRHTAVKPLNMYSDRQSARHLYVVFVPSCRDDIFARLRQVEIGVNVHYKPVHLHTWYRKNLGTEVGDCPTAEWAYEHILTLPLYPSLTEVEQDFVIEQILEACNA